MTHQKPPWKTYNKRQQGTHYFIFSTFTFPLVIYKTNCLSSPVPFSELKLNLYFVTNFLQPGCQRYQKERKNIRQNYKKRFFILKMGLIKTKNLPRKKKHLVTWGEGKPRRSQSRWAGRQQLLHVGPALAQAGLAKEEPALALQPHGPGTFGVPPHHPQSWISAQTHWEHLWAPR